jgi:probable F420-dependent oxidoreductase
MRVDVSLAMAGPEGATERARELIDTGVDGLFTFENAHDVFTPLVLATQATAGRLDLMTNVAMSLPRSPLHMAYAANDLQLLNKGGFRLGIGSQIRPHIEKRYGGQWRKPVAQMRESVMATKMILDHFAGEVPFNFVGEFTRHTLMTPNFNPGPNPYGKPPVLVGALGPKMTEMAAEVADGILVMPFNSVRHLNERTLPAIASGLTTANRSMDDIEIVVEVICAVGETDEQIARAALGVKALMGFYGSTPSYRPVLDVEGWGDLQPHLNALSKQGDWLGMASAVSDEMLATIGVVGGPNEVGAEIARRFGSVADRVCLYFPGYAISDACIADVVAAIKAAVRN